MALLDCGLVGPETQEEGIPLVIASHRTAGSPSPGLSVLCGRTPRVSTGLQDSNVTTDHNLKLPLHSCQSACRCALQESVLLPPPDHPSDYSPLAVIILTVPDIAVRAAGNT